jgi:hypothetical protein
VAESLLSGTDRSGQTAVIYPVIVVPKWLPQFDATAKHFDLLLGTGGCVGGKKLPVGDGIKILIVTVLENGFENVLAKTAHCFMNLVRVIHQRQAPSLAPEG